MEGIALVIMLVVLIHSGRGGGKKERSAPTESLEVGGLREDLFSDGSLPLAHCFFLCKVNISWLGRGKPAAPTVLGMDSKRELVRVFDPGFALNLQHCYIVLSTLVSRRARLCEAAGADRLELILLFYN